MALMPMKISQELQYAANFKTADHGMKYKKCLDTKPKLK